jgi:hypothetical protein
MMKTETNRLNSQCKRANRTLLHAVVCVNGINDVQVLQESACNQSSLEDALEHEIRRQAHR